MKHKIEQTIKIPEGISCFYENGKISCTNNTITLERKIEVPEVEVNVSGNEIKFICKSGNKNHYKKIMSNITHINNLLRGLEQGYNYQLEVCHVHFPVTLKVDGNTLSITNFFGEKKPRHAKILPNVKVEINGQKITISSADREAAGQTAANFERATKLRKKDRRVFQDGIYIVKKPEANSNVQKI